MHTVILHLGTHKAASTSVQLFWAKNRERLRSAGICYPLPPEPTSFAHHGLAWSIIKRYTSLERRPANYCLEDALTAFTASGAPTLLLSSEDFLTTSFYDGFLDEFFARLRETFDRIVVCAYVRSRRDFFNSSYNQWVKSLSYFKDFDAYLKQVLHGVQAPMHYTRALNLWSNQADQIHYLPFKADYFGDRPELHLSRTLGMDESALATFEPFAEGALNESIGPAAVVAFRRLSHRLHEAAWYDHYLLTKREQVLHQLEEKARRLGWNEEKYRPMRPEHLRAINEVFGADDQAFSRQHFGVDWNALFPQDQVRSGSATDAEEAFNASTEQQIQHFVSDGYHLAREIYLAA